MVNQKLLNELLQAKEKRINIRVSSQFYDKMKFLKEHTGVPYSEMIRRGITLYVDKFGVED